MLSISLPMLSVVKPFLLGVGIITLILCGYHLMMIENKNLHNTIPTPAQLLVNKIIRKGIITMASLLGCYIFIEIAASMSAVKSAQSTLQWVCWLFSGKWVVQSMLYVIDYYYNSSTKFGGKFVAADDKYAGVEQMPIEPKGNEQGGYPPYV